MNTSETITSKKHHAFIIGINEYQIASSLATPTNDATAIGTVLEKKYNFQIKNLFNPNNKTLRGYLEDMIKSVKEDDSVLFYFAGHGIARQTQKGLEGYIIPSDGDVRDEDTLISMDFLLESYKQLKCKHFLLILDCCFSGAFRWAESYRGIGDDTEKLYKQHYEYYSQNPSWQVLTSTSHTQKAIDRFGSREPDAQQHSPFAKCLIDGLEGQADLNHDKIITLSELHAYLQKHIPTITGAYGNPQNVGLFPLEKHKNGEFMFIPNDFDPFELRPSPDQNPYMGLQAYTSDGKSLFFGREKAAEELYEKIKNSPLTVVIGASGTGKSSLVNAGIIPKLEKDGDKVATMRPNKDPLAELAHLKGFKVLVIDQFEELVTQSEPSKAEEFKKILRGYITTGEKKIILTVRIDFEPQIDKTGIETEWREGRYLIPPFMPEELRQVIITPAARVGFFIEDGKLVSEIVNEVVHYPGSLPLLSFTLSELFERCKRNPYRTIQYADYKALGGVTGSLQESADRVVRELKTENERKTLENMALRMVSLSGGEIAGKKVMDNDLEFDKADENDRVKLLKNKLIAARLIVSNTANNEQGFIEPAHDALVRSWSTLSTWIKTRGEESLLLQNKLTDAVNDYETHKKDKSRLWHNDPRLDLLRGQLISSEKWLNKRELDFVQKSVDLKKRNRNRTIVIVVAVMLALAGLAWFGFRQAGLAESNQKVAENNLSKFLQEQKAKNIDRLPILMQEAENFEKGEEPQYALKRYDEIQILIDSFKITKQEIGHISFSLDTFKFRREASQKLIKQ